MAMDALRNIGLTEIEAKVYVTLLEEGPSHAGHVSRKSGIHRRMVYDAIERLIKKGLVSYIVKNNKRLFAAVDPERLLDIVREQEENIKKVLPGLKLAYGTSRQKQETTFFRGHAGVKSVFEDQIREGKEQLVLAPSLVARELFPGYFHWFDERRKQKRIPVRLLADTESAGQFRDIPLARIRQLPGMGSPATSTVIYGSKLAIFYWDRKRPFVVVITQKEIADAYRAYFEALWKKARQ